MSDWLTDLKFWCQTNAAQRMVVCNVEDAERIQAAAVEAGIGDLITLTPFYVPPPGCAYVTGLDDKIDTTISEEFFQALGVDKYV